MSALNPPVKNVSQWVQSHPLIKSMMSAEPVYWLNPAITAFAPESLSVSSSQIDDARARLQRFSPYIAKAFPETESAGGLIESPLRAVPQVQHVLAQHYNIKLPGRLLLKCDNELPISGSIKARGGIYEVLKYAEMLALKAGLLSVEDNYTVLAGDACRTLFSNHSIQVGSTGNLGLSIGIMGAKLGFQVTVHMSSDARQWKKDLLRSLGVQVKEYSADYSVAVTEGRQAAQSLSNCHFVDDENSVDLLLGYSVAAERLGAQLKSLNIEVNAERPLFVYLPCGVGGGPGGVAFGLKHVFGDHVHCFFAEPTHSPCMLLGMYTGLHDAVSVQDFGIDNRTCADGLAVGRPSSLVGKLMEPLLSGVYTCEDDELHRLLVKFKDAEDLALEPSALASVPGAFRLMTEGREYLKRFDLVGKLDNATHIAWATGGSMVPEKEQQDYYQQGQALL